MLKRLLILCPLILILTHSLTAQVKLLSLDEVITIAQEQSLESIVARNRFRESYWEFRTYRADLLPRLYLNGTPSFNRSIETSDYTGVLKTIEHNNMSNYGNISLEQNIPFTGGTLSINSSLQRDDDFARDSFFFSSTPYTIEYSQSLLRYNAFRWEMKIEPLKFEEAKKTYLQTIEEISIKAVGYFFDLALAQLNVTISKANYANSDTLYKIARGRYNIGTIAQNDLLQMELDFLKSGASLTEANIELQDKKFRLRSFLGYNNNIDIELLIPTQTPQLQINIETAQTQARQNNPDIVGYERQLLEARRDVRKANAERGLNASIYASYGLGQSAHLLNNAYKEPMLAQSFNIGLSIPIVDWGKGKGGYKMALSNQQAVEATIRQAESDFDQNIFLNTTRFNLQRNQLLIAAKADTVAQMRYDVTKQRFLIGKIGVTDLNLALQDKDENKRSYISALRYYWNLYYTIRQLTLFDFENNQPLSTDFKKLLY